MGPYISSISGFIASRGLIHGETFYPEHYRFVGQIDMQSWNAFGVDAFTIALYELWGGNNQPAVLVSCEVFDGNSTHCLANSWGPWKGKFD